MNPARSRRNAPLIARAPIAEDTRPGSDGSATDPLAQLKELEDLCARGLLSPEELAAQKARVLGRA